MAFVRTINGDIAPETLGSTNAHDHLIRIGGGEVIHDPDHLLDSVDKAVEEAQRFLDAGGSTIVDMCPADCGRDIRSLLEITRRLPDLNVVVTTGFHQSKNYEDTRTHWVTRYTVDQITELIVADVIDGIDVHDYSGPLVQRSSAKAGVIKIATAYGKITPFERKCIEACAYASVETGAPVSTHTTQGTMAHEQAELLISYGVSPEKISIGHIHRNYDIYYHAKLCDMGVNVMYDGTNRIKYQPDSARIQLIRDMVAAGFADRITLGTDSGKRSYQKAYGSGSGIDYDLVITKPRLLEEGFDPEVVESFFVDNPARCLSFDTARTGSAGDSVIAEAQAVD
jgi:5-phospho-D-xylono-1,4-lactonase